jgi:hypothetical protein
MFNILGLVYILDPCLACGLWPMAYYCLLPKAHCFLFVFSQSWLSIGSSAMPLGGASAMGTSMCHMPWSPLMAHAWGAYALGGASGAGAGMLLCMGGSSPQNLHSDMPFWLCWQLEDTCNICGSEQCCRIVCLSLVNPTNLVSKTLCQKTHLSQTLCRPNIFQSFTEIPNTCNEFDRDHHPPPWEVQPPFVT